MAMPKGRALAIRKVKTIYDQSRTGSKEEYRALKKWIELCITLNHIREPHSRSWGISTKLRKKAFKKWENIAIQMIRKANTLYKLQEINRKAPYPSERVSKFIKKKMEELSTAFQ